MHCQESFFYKCVCFLITQVITVICSNIQTASFTSPLLTFTCPTSCLGEVGTQVQYQSTRGRSSLSTSCTRSPSSIDTSCGSWQTSHPICHLYDLSARVCKGTILPQVPRVHMKVCIHECACVYVLCMYAYHVIVLYLNRWD